MIKSMLAAATVLTLMTGGAFAQTASSTTTSTQYSAPSIAPVPMSDTTVSTMHKTTDDNGVVIDKSKTSATSSGVTPFGDSTTTHKSTESTTVR
jgi:hypothetical protein